MVLHHTVKKKKKKKGVVKNTKCLNFSAGNWAGLSPGATCGHLPDWLDQNGHHSGNQCPAGEGGRENGSTGHEGLQGPAAHRHSGPAQAVRLGWLFIFSPCEAELRPVSTSWSLWRTALGHSLSDFAELEGGAPGVCPLSLL